MAQQTFSENKNLEETCQEILSFPDIRFCGIINQFGHLIAGGFKEGIKPLESDEKRRMSYMQMVLDINMRKEHNESLGPIEYSATKRGKVVMISIPLNDNVVLVSAEPKSDPHQITKIVTHLFKSSSKVIAA